MPDLSEETARLVRELDGIRSALIRSGWPADSVLDDTLARASARLQVLDRAAGPRTLDPTPTQYRIGEPARHQGEAPIWVGPPRLDGQGYWTRNMDDAWTFETWEAAEAERVSGRHFPRDTGVVYPPRLPEPTTRQPPTGRARD